VIIRELTLENFHGYRLKQSVELGPEPFQLFEGENGAGKSTLVEAIRTVLLKAHNTAGQQAEKMRPRATDLGPEITLIFEHEGARYRIWKRYLDRPRARLEKFTPAGEFRLQSEGKTADQDVLKMLGGESGEARLALLLAGQDGLELPELSGKALDDIRAMLGGQLAGRLGTAFERALEKAYGVYFTPTGREKAELQSARDLLAEAEREAVQRRAVLAQLEESRERAAAHGCELARVEWELTGVLGELAGAEPFEARANALAREFENASLRLRAAEASHQRLAERKAALAQAIAAIAKLSLSGPGLEATAVDKRRAAESAANLAAEARREYERSSQPDPEMEAARARVEAARRFLSDSAELAAVRERLRIVTALAARHVETGTAAAALNAPSAAQLEQIRDLDRKMSAARTRLEASRIHLEFSAERSFSLIDVLEGEPGGSHSVAAGGTLEISGDGVVDFRLPGEGRIRVTGPSGDIAALRREAATLEARRGALVAPFGCGEIAELESRNAQLTVLESERRDVESQLRMYPAAAALHDKAEVLDARVAAEPEWRERPPDPDSMAAEASAAGKAREIRRNAAYANLRDLAAIAATAERESVQAKAQWDSNRSAFQAAEQRLGELQDGWTPVERDEEIARQKREQDAARAEVDRLHAECAGLPADAADRAARLRKQRDGLQDERQRSRTAVHGEEVRQHTILSGSPYSDFAESEEKLAGRRRRKEIAELRAAAIRQVWTKLHEFKDRALAGLSGPVAEKATAILEQIAGRRLAEISLDAGFAANVRPEDGGTPSEIAEMSGGEQEQIWTATRLALTDVLAGTAPQTIVFDDVFAHTDNERLGRILDLLGQRGHAQFLILTCHPERYRSLASARRFAVRDCRVEPRT
jgi:energy-coupling factor transporter ATP-binding protein EcfA2